MIRITMPPPLLVPPLRTPVHRRIPPTSIRRINNVVMNQRARLNQLQSTCRPQHRRRILPPIPQAPAGHKSRPHIARADAFPTREHIIFQQGDGIPHSLAQRGNGGTLGGKKLRQVRGHNAGNLGKIRGFRCFGHGGPF